MACGQRASSRPNKTEKVGRWKCDQTIGLTLSACTAWVESWVFQRRRKCRIYLFARLFPRVRCRVRIGSISENCQSIRSTYLIARRENVRRDVSSNWTITSSVQGTRRERDLGRTASLPGTLSFAFVNLIETDVTIAGNFLRFLINVNATI